MEKSKHRQVGRKNLNLIFFFNLTFWGKRNLFNSNRKNPNNKCHTFNRNTRVLGAKIKTDCNNLIENLRGYEQL